jgi:hypothetical protein
VRWPRSRAAIQGLGARPQGCHLSSPRAGAQLQDRLIVGGSAATAIRRSQCNSRFCAASPFGPAPQPFGGVYPLASTMQALPGSFARTWGLTCRSTGAPTAGHLARAALAVYAAPRGQGVHPSSPGYLYVRRRRSHMFAVDPQVLGLLGTAVSAAVAALGYRGKLRHERRRTTRVVLYYLLEMHDRVGRLQRIARDLPLQAPTAIKSILEKQGHRVSSQDLLTANALLTPKLRDFAATQMDELRLEVIEPYRRALAELAKDDPILAFRLKGQEVLNLHAKQVVGMISQAIAEDPNASPELPSVLEQELSHFARESVLKDLALVTRKTAWKCGFWTYLAASRRLEFQERRLATQDLDTQLGAFTLRMAELGQRLQQVPAKPPTRGDA